MEQNDPRNNPNCGAKQKIPVTTLTTWGFKMTFQTQGQPQ
jgi:hypothetical protein